MTTVKQLIDYLKDLPPDTTVRVLEEVRGSYQGTYTKWVDLKLPQAAAFVSEGCSENFIFYRPDGKNNILDLGEN
jgi:hypothetical protein